MALLKTSRRARLCLLPTRLSRPLQPAAGALLLLWAALAAAMAGEDFAALGAKALEAENYAEAVELLKKATEADPEDFTSYFHLGLAYSFLQQDQEAIAAWRKTLALQPKLYPALLNLGYVLTRQKQYEEAVELLRKALAARPGELKPQLYLGDALLESGAAAEAERCYRQALASHPDAAEAWAGLARARLAQSDSAGAVEALDQAVARDTAYQPELLALAEKLEALNQSDLAATLYARFPDNPAATERLADLRLRAGKFAEAARELERVVAASPTSANRAALAVAYANSGQPERALATLEQALQADSQNVELRLIAGRLLRDAKRFQPAAQQFHAAVTLDPQNAEAWSELAAMLLQLEQYPQALAALGQLERLGKAKPGHVFLQAITLDRLQQYKEALAAYEKFLHSSQGANPDQEFQARQRVRVIQRILDKR